jgi:hypothetical protein
MESGYYLSLRWYVVVWILSTCKMDGIVLVASRGIWYQVCKGQGQTNASGKFQLVVIVIV